MTEPQAADDLLKLWIFTVIVLGTGAVVSQFMVPKFEAAFASADADVPLLTDVVLASPDYTWILPVLALTGYLLRRRQAGSANLHAAGATGLLVIGAGCGLFLPVLR